MKSITKITLLSFVMLLITISATAQTEWQKKKAQEKADEIKVILELDDEMTNEVYKIYLATQVKLKELNQKTIDGTITEEEKKVESQYLWQNSVIQIEEIIGSELAKKYKIHRKKLWLSQKATEG